MMVGGWFDLELMYRGLFSGFLNGEYVFWDRLNDTSKKSVALRFISVAILYTVVILYFMLFYFIYSCYLYFILYLYIVNSFYIQVQ